MSSKKLAGLCVVLAIPALGVAHAQPGDRWGGTTYPGQPQAAPTSVPSSPIATADTGSLRLKPRANLRAKHGIQTVDSSPVEKTLAPPPAPSNAKTPAGEHSDGPHESPAPTIQALVTKHARENGVPENLASAVVRIESRFNPNARGGSAIGLMQIKVQTARGMGFSGDARGLMAPETNLHFGMKVLADAYKTSKGDLCMTLARYQSGHLTTRLSAANRAYCARARSFMAKA